MIGLSVFRPVPLFGVAAGLRLGLLLYGVWQDGHSAFKYTDIDYLVFTDAARAVVGGGSPYARETYRYTPLLAWLLAPTALSSAVAVFSLGKLLFAAADLLAGWLLLRILRHHGGVSADVAGALAAVWLWNPMVAAISTRGSSEGLLAVLVVGMLWAALDRRFTLTAVLLGLAVHFKIYPFVYAPALVWWMDEARCRGTAAAAAAVSSAGLPRRFARFVSPERVRLALVSSAVFMGLNAIMFVIYGMPFLEQTYLHHVTRIDHRHNFSPYNVLLYLSSTLTEQATVRIESVAFLPQLLLSTVLIPLSMAKKDLPTAMMAQTFAFVTFNKVCTSQYFLWYMVFLPLYLPRSSFVRKPALGIAALGLWIATQAVWLEQAFLLEFWGISTFVPGLLLATAAFFLVNCWILGVMIQDGCALVVYSVGTDLAAINQGLH